MFKFVLLDSLKKLKCVVMGVGAKFLKLNVLGSTAFLSNSTVVHFEN